jgi:hypothetical protein
MMYNQRYPKFFFSFCEVVECLPSAKPAAAVVAAAAAAAASCCGKTSDV